MANRERRDPLASNIISYCVPSFFLQHESFLILVTQGQGSHEYKKK